MSYRGISDSVADWSASGACVAGGTAGTAATCSTGNGWICAGGGTTPGRRQLALPAVSAQSQAAEFAPRARRRLVPPAAGGGTTERPQPAHRRAEERPQLVLPAMSAQSQAAGSSRRGGDLSNRQGRDRRRRRHRRGRNLLHRLRTLHDRRGRSRPRRWRSGDLLHAQRLDRRGLRLRAAATCSSGGGCMSAAGGGTDGEPSLARATSPIVAAGADWPGTTGSP